MPCPNQLGGPLRGRAFDRRLLPYLALAMSDFCELQDPGPEFYQPLWRDLEWNGTLGMILPTDPASSATHEMRVDIAFGGMGDGKAIRLCEKTLEEVR